MASVTVPAQRAELDRAVALLRDRKDVWARLPPGEKIAFLVAARERTGACAERWVETAARAKGLAPDSPLAGEEWLTGPWALIYALNRLIESLQAIARRRTPWLPRGTVRTRPNGQVTVRVFPRSLYDRVLLNGVSAEVWMEPGVTRETLPG